MYYPFRVAEINAFLINNILAIIIMISMGCLALSGYFLNFTTLREFTDKDATQWYMIIAGFAALIFCLIIKRRRDWFRRMFGLYFK